MTAVQLMNIQRLLEAAEYLDRREKECEHGYASTFPSSIQNTNYQRQNKCRNKKFHNNHNRSTHNELEKNRRAPGKDPPVGLTHSAGLTHQKALGGMVPGSCLGVLMEVDLLT
uniref:MAX interactor 1, dimerization protein n=1 Tax=Oncorhynchus mykiss TaxID=8022 RepID=A0A8K9VAL8_ONCMY